MTNAEMQDTVTPARRPDANSRPVVIYYRTKAGIERSALGLYNLLSKTIEVRGMNVPSRELDFWLRKTHDVELLMIEVQRMPRRRAQRGV